MTNKLLLLILTTSIFSFSARAMDQDDFSGPLTVTFKLLFSEPSDPVIQADITPSETTLEQLGKTYLDGINKIYWTEVIPNPYIKRSQIETSDLTLYFSGKSFSLRSFANPTPPNQLITNIGSILQEIKGKNEFTVYCKLQVLGERNFNCQIKKIHRIIDSPLITLANYCYTLCIGDPIYGYGDSTGNLISWLQLPANKNRTERRGAIIEELPLFQVTISPIIEGNRFRCDYTLPVEGGDLSRGPSTLSIYRDASPEEIQMVNALPIESNESKIIRELNWKTKHKHILEWGLNY
jgi:hypothetical protein